MEDDRQIQEEAWSRLLDSNASPEQFAKDVSPEFLEFIKAEAPALDVVRRAKIVISLLFLSDERIQSMSDAVMDFCRVCEKDDEEWIRVVTGIVLRWLKRAPKDAQDSFSESEKRILKQISDLSSQKDALKFSLPGDIVPMHWPFLDSRALPPNFSLADSEANHHFTPKPRVKRVKALIGESKSVQAPPTSIPAPTPSPGVPKIPEKILGWLKHPNLILIDTDRERLNKFFTDPALANITEQVVIPVYEERTPSAEKPGFIEILKYCVKLSPEPKWGVMIKKVIQRQASGTS